MFDVAGVKYFDPTPKIPEKKKKQDQQVDSQGWLFECLDWDFPLDQAMVEADGWSPWQSVYPYHF